MRHAYQTVWLVRAKCPVPNVCGAFHAPYDSPNHAMTERAKATGIEAMMLTVDTITGGNRERDLRTGFSMPLRLTFGGLLQFALKPLWGPTAYPMRGENERDMKLMGRTMARQRSPSNIRFRYQCSASPIGIIQVLVKPFEADVALYPKHSGKRVSFAAGASPTEGFRSSSCKRDTVV